MIDGYQGHGVSYEHPGMLVFHPLDVLHAQGPLLESGPVDGFVARIRGGEEQEAGRGGEGRGGEGRGGEKREFILY